MTSNAGLIVGVDGGGSKTDAVALTIEGELIGHGVGPGSSPHFEGLPKSVETVDAAVQSALSGATAIQANIYLSGLDLPPEVTAYSDAVARLDWTDHDTVVDNDLWALLRAGTESRDAVAIVCGTGINAVGVRGATADRPAAVARFAALGSISGDWGGGSGLGEQALWHAARAEDGRGPATALHAAILTEFGVASIAELTESLHFGRREMSDLTVLSPRVFEAARDGDPVAIELVDHQATEIVAYARASLTRLDLLRREVPIVLGGGVIRAGDARLMAGVAAGLSAEAPHAFTVIVDARPIVGAGLLALESAGAAPAALARARQALESI